MECINCPVQGECRQCVEVIHVCESSRIIELETQIFSRVGVSVADPGFMEGGFKTRVRAKILGATPTFGKPRPPKRVVLVTCNINSSTK